MQKGNRIRPMIGGGIGHLGEITQRMGQLDQALSSLRHGLFPTQAVPTGQTALPSPAGSEPSATLTRASPFHYGATFTPHITFAY